MHRPERKVVNKTSKACSTCDNGTSDISQNTVVTIRETTKVSRKAGATIKGFSKASRDADATMKGLTKVSRKTAGTRKAGETPKELTKVFSKANAPTKGLTKVSKKTGARSNKGTTKSPRKTRPASDGSALRSSTKQVQRRRSPSPDISDINSNLARLKSLKGSSRNKTTRTNFRKANSRPDIAVLRKTTAEGRGRNAGASELASVRHSLLKVPWHSIKNVSTLQRNDATNANVNDSILHPARLQHLVSQDNFSHSQRRDSVEDMDVDDDVPLNGAVVNDAFVSGTPENDVPNNEVSGNDDFNKTLENYAPVNNATGSDAPVNATSVDGTVPVNDALIMPVDPRNDTLQQPEGTNPGQSVEDNDEVESVDAVALPLKASSSNNDAAQPMDGRTGNESAAFVEGMGAITLDSSNDTSQSEGTTRGQSSQKKKEVSLTKMKEWKLPQPPSIFLNVEHNWRQKIALKGKKLPVGVERVDPFPTRGMMRVECNEFSLAQRRGYGVFVTHAINGGKKSKVYQPWGGLNGSKWRRANRTVNQKVQVRPSMNLNEKYQQRLDVNYRFRYYRGTKTEENVDDKILKNMDDGILEGVVKLGMELGTHAQATNPVLITILERK